MRFSTTNLQRLVVTRRNSLYFKSICDFMFDIETHSFSFQFIFQSVSDASEQDSPRQAGRGPWMDRCLCRHFP